jgi:hypothetical protein
MQESTRLNGVSALTLVQSNRTQDAGDSDRLKRTAPAVASVDVFPQGGGSGTEPGSEFNGDYDQSDRVLELEFQEWIGCIARAKARAIAP